MFHVDESYDASYHFHLGLLIDGKDAADASAELDDLVKECFWNDLCPYEAELHGFEVFGRCKSWKAASPADAVGVFDRTLDVLAACDVEVIFRGFDLTRFRKKYGDLDHYPWAFENLLERLNERLLERGEYAVVIADEQHAYKDELQRQVMLGRQRAPYGGYRAQQLTQVLDTAHFVDSKLSRLTQLADMVAFVVRRRASVPREADARAEAAMARLHGKVRDAIPDPSGQYATIRS